MYKLVALLGLLLLTNPAPAVVSVKVAPLVGIGPVFVRVKALVEPHEQNRKLYISIDGPTYLRVSAQELHGADESVMHIVEWPSVPSGEFTITARVFGPGDKVRGYDTVQVSYR